MATAPHKLLTLEEYDQRYGAEAGWEFWFGEAVRKPVPTWYHGVLQALMAQLLFEAGYIAGSEIDVKIDSRWQPRPDVLGATEMTGRYPTKPVDVVIEILSDDQFRYLLGKCQNYQHIGISHIYVLDPEQERSWRWSADKQELERIETLPLPNGKNLASSLIWDEFHRRIGK